MITEVLVSLLILFPAVMLTLRRSPGLVDYAILVIAFNRLIRRLVDYYVHEAFNPTSLISITPLVIGGLLFVVGYSRIRGLDRRSQSIILLLFAALSFGFVVGFVRSPMGAIYSLGEWISGIGAFLFAATHSGPVEERNRWMKTAVVCAVVVAAYGWWQYYTIPPWDGSWLVWSGMDGYMGQPKPTEMAVFSTMNERGPAAGFMAFGILPIILNKVWRQKLLGWLPVLFVLATIPLTGVRSALIIIVLITFIHPFLASGRGLGRTLFFAIILMVGVQSALPLLPGGGAYADRFSSQSLTGEGSSLQSRLGIMKQGFRNVLSNPIGYGLGSSGMANRVAGKDQVSLGDAGYAQVFYQFGWVGGLCFFYALWMIWKTATIRYIACRRLQIQADPFLPATRSVLIGMIVFLFVGDVFSGFNLSWLIFGAALNVQTFPPVEYEDDSEETEFPNGY